MLNADNTYDEQLELSGGDSSFTDTVPFVSGDADLTIIHIWLSVNRGALASSEGGYDVTVTNNSLALTYFSQNSVCTQNNSFSASFFATGDIEGDTIEYSVEDNGNSGNPDYKHGMSISTIPEHTHGDGSYATADHNHPDGSYDIDNADLDDISIGDSVSDAGSLNSSSITWYLDYFDSGWVNKASGVVAATQGTQIDITDSGTYPDEVGYWRVRIDPNNSSPDFVQGIVRLKHALDN